MMRGNIRAAWICFTVILWAEKWNAFTGGFNTAALSSEGSVSGGLNNSTSGPFASVSGCQGNTGSVRQGELAARLQLEKSTVSRLVRQMEAHVWIQRNSDRHDGRAVLIRLTKRGRDTASDLARARQANFANSTSFTFDLPKLKSRIRLVPEYEF